MKWSAYLPRLAALGLLAFGAGCGGGHDAMEKQLTELRAEIARLRAGQAAIGERLDAIDIERGTFAKGAAAAPPALDAPVKLGDTPRTPGPPATAALATPRPGDRDRPELDVVRLSPSEGDGDAAEDASRPVVRAVGDGAAPRTTLTNKSIGARPAPKKGAAPAASKKQADGDVHPGAKP